MLVLKPKEHLLDLLNIKILVHHPVDEHALTQVDWSNLHELLAFLCEVFPISSLRNVAFLHQLQEVRNCAFFEGCLNILLRLGFARLFGHRESEDRAEIADFGNFEIQTKGCFAGLL